MTDMTAFALIFTLAAIGISEASYLIRKRLAAEKPSCPIGGNCALVLTSRYSKLFVVPNDILGLTFYISVLFVASFLVIGVPPFGFWVAFLKLSVLVSSLISVFLTYLQWQVVRAWCFWCLMSALTIWLMEIIISFL